MPMSKDRIEFTAYAHKGSDRIVANAMVRAFGMTQGDALSAILKGKTIICRPSQFGRFIVYRIEEGVEVNQIKMLNPRIIQPIEAPIDVSKNPAEGNGSVNMDHD